MDKYFKDSPASLGNFNDNFNLECHKPGIIRSFSSPNTDYKPQIINHRVHFVREYAGSVNGIIRVIIIVNILSNLYSQLYLKPTNSYFLSYFN